MFCRPVLTAPALVRRDGTVLADAWLPDLVRLGELERHLGDGVIEAAVDAAAGAGRLRPRQRRRTQAPRAGPDSAAARDFADVYVLARRFGKETLLARATQVDAGFDARVLAGMIATLDRFTDSEIPVPDGLIAEEWICSDAATLLCQLS